MSDAIPVILDTDIGSDIDDAVALAYLLRQKRCRLLGITTVTGEVERRAACAQVVCQAAGREDVPIHCGASAVLLHGPGQPECPQYAAIAHRPHRKQWPKNTAIDFLRRTIRQRPGEITLLSIGPLTNLALLFAVDPEIPSLLKQVVSMGGVFFENAEKREWNAMVDPVATAMTYKTPLGRHVNFGLDVTLQCKMPAAEVRRRFKGPLLEVVAEMAEVWFNKSEKLTFHDPLAAAAIFRPELCGYVRGRIGVSVEAPESGRTPFVEEAKGRHEVAREVDVAGFFEEYFRVVEGGRQEC